MKAIAVFASAALALAAGAAQASPDLAKSAGCTTCHDVSAKKMGPSFKSIAAKHKSEKDAEAKLLAVLNDPKKHPAQKASDADKKALVAWILQQ